MAAARSGWSMTNVSQNIEYTHKWAIQNFDLAMEVGMGKIESGKFYIPGVPGEFHMVVEKKTEEYQDYYTYSKAAHTPTLVKIGDQEFDVKFYFSVALKSTDTSISAAGMLEVIKEGMKTLSGKFGDSVNHKYFFASSSFSPDRELKYHRNGKFCNANGFFTSGSTCLLNLVAKVTIPGKLTSLAGSAEEEMKQNRLFDFQPLLLDPKHSDVVLKCADTRFLCHKVSLASRYYL